MYFDLLNTTCVIYRLSGLTGYDFTASEEGEVSEAWPVLATGVPCRLDRRNSISRRRSDGLVETGTTTLFVQAGTDIIDGDRVSVDGKFYHVGDSTQIYGIKDLHHKEVIIEVIDWVDFS